MEEKKNKGLIWLIVILIIIIGIFVGNILYKKVTFVEQGTKEEIIKKNFLSDIKLVKYGNGTEQQKYLLCDDIYDCKKIDEFSIDSIEFYENGEDNKPVYKFELSWSCKGDGECFYNEQYGFNDETKMNEAKTFYKVDENNKVVEGLGNSYDFRFEEDEGETNELAVLLKDYFIYQEKEEHKDLYQNGNVKYWNINSIKYLGYYKNKSDIKYYAAYGNFKCKDNSGGCIYMEQLDDITTGEIPFKVSFAVKNGEIKELLGTIFDDMVIGKEPDVSKNFVLKNEVVASNISTKKVDAELIVDTMDNYFNEYKLKKQIDNYTFELGGFLEKNEYCEDYDKNEDLKDRIEIVVSVTYENLVGESFVITGNDDNTHFDNKNYYRAGAFYVLVKEGNKYKFYDSYTGC